MRQLFSWRLVAALAALAGLVLLVNALIVDDESLDAVVAPETIERRIDLLEPIASAEQSPDFVIDRNGVTSGFLDLVLDDDRVVRVAPGTLGEIDCEQLDEPDGCAVFADMLGDAVIWFAVLPQAPRQTVELPPIVDLQDGLAVFENGWQIPFPPVIERECDDESILSFSDFLRRYGPESVSIVDLESGQVVAVRCADQPDP